jgi:hypothetical protein
MTIPQVMDAGEPLQNDAPAIAESNLGRTLLERCLGTLAIPRVAAQAHQIPAWDQWFLRQRRWLVMAALYPQRHEV